MSTFNRTYQAVISVTLSLLMLMTSLTLLIDKHYCKGELQSVSFLNKAKSCHSEPSKIGQEEVHKMTACPHHQKTATSSTAQNNHDLNEEGCCQNKTTIIQADNDLAKSDLPLPIFQQFQPFVIAYLLVFHTKTTADRASLRDMAYQSPIFSRDIYVLSEAFLL